MTREEFFYQCIDVIEHWLNGNRKLSDLREETDKLYNEVTKPHWISVEDELPKSVQDNGTNLGEFLFYTEPIDEDGCYDGRYRTGFYNHITNTYELRPNRLGNTAVTHWMRLPQAPKKEE